jgi:DNA-binding response OmpR family regulator
MRILVVEDNHKIANSIRKGLEQEAYAVDCAFDGISGFDLAATEEYDLIILDLMLPHMDGVTICSKLRSDEKIHTPILILTAKGQVEDRVQGLNCGADDYLTKPFSFAELLARIKALARRPAQTNNTILKCHNLQLDTIEFSVQRQGKSIDLTKKEFSLLRYLLHNKDRIVTKEQIINHVWNYDADVLPNTVEVYIGYLRNKIDKPYNKKLIKTVRGFGYKLSCS